MRVSNMTEELKGKALSGGLPSYIQKETMEKTDGDSTKENRGRKDSRVKIKSDSVQGNIRISRDTGIGSPDLAKGGVYDRDTGFLPLDGGTVYGIEEKPGC